MLRYYELNGSCDDPVDAAAEFSEAKDAAVDVVDGTTVNGTSGEAATGSSFGVISSND